MMGGFISRPFTARAARVAMASALGVALIASLSAFGDGTFPVGTGPGRVPPGTYTTAGGAGCYWERTDPIGNINANDFEPDPQRHMVTVLGSDASFTSDGCGNWTPLAGALRADSTAPLPPGTWRVGPDIAGNNRWLSTGSSDSCYWERDTDFRGEFASVIDNYFGSTPALVVVSATDVAFHSSGCGAWIRDAQLDPGGALDGVSATSGGIRAAGWARDIETTAPIAVHLYVDGVARAAVTADVQRADVGAHGFTGVVSTGAGQHQVCAYGINVGLGINRQLGCRSITVVGNPIGRLEGLSYDPSGLRVSGWSLDPNVVDPIDVHVYVDGVGRGSTQASLPRPDVAGAFPGYGDGHGFATTVPVNGGAHTVCAYGINVGVGANAVLGCRRFVVPTNPFGRLDTVTARYDVVRVGGWAIDPNTTASIPIHVYVDGVARAVITADSSRPDVAAAHPAFGPNHGFDGADLQLANGAHRICVYAINQGPGGNTTLGCRTVTTNGNPHGSVDEFVETAAGLRVSGWAFDPDSVDPIDVHVYVDGVFRQALTTALARPDVESAVPGAGPNTGYDGAEIATAVGAHQVCVYGLNVGNGGNQKLRCQTVTVRTP
jgi:hypothetical protein